MHRKRTTLYNVIFPIWFLWILPMCWVFILPANLLIDALVIVLTLKFLHCKDILATLGFVIWRVWLIGFVADLIGRGTHLSAIIARAGCVAARYPVCLDTQSLHPSAGARMDTRMYCRLGYSHLLRGAQIHLAPGPASRGYLPQPCAVPRGFYRPLYLPDPGCLGIKSPVHL